MLRRLIVLVGMLLATFVGKGQTIDLESVVGMHQDSLRAYLGRRMPNDYLDITLLNKSYYRDKV